MSKLTMCRQSILTAAIAALISACASSPTVTTATDDSVPSVAAGAPTAPPVAATVPSESLLSKTEPAPVKKEGVLATIEKMENNRLTQYRKQTESYLFFVGTELQANYKPGKGLTLRQDIKENALECRYDENGKLDLGALDTKSADEMKKACNELMFTLDQELED